jgi:hypothetical protein
MLLLVSPALSFLTASPANAIGAPCPAGSNLYPASIISATVVYEDAYTQHNVTIDIVKHPNATLDIESGDPSNPDNFPIYSSGITFSTVAESDVLNNSTGVVDNSGTNGDYDYQGCISPVQASTTYTVTIPIAQPASYANYSQIVDDVGGSAVEFWIHWVYASSDTVSPSSSSSSTSTIAASQFPSDTLPWMLSAVVMTAALAARSLRRDGDSQL